MIVELVSAVALRAAIAGHANHTVRWRLTVAEAERLAVATAQDENPGSEKLPGFQADGSRDTYAPDYEGFHVFWDGSDVAIGTLGQYDVNMLTGDVWNGTSCHEYSGRRLVRLQMILRKKIGLSRLDYMRLRTRGPMC